MAEPGEQEIDQEEKVAGTSPRIFLNTRHREALERTAQARGEKTQRGKLPPLSQAPIIPNAAHRPAQETTAAPADTGRIIKASSIPGQR